MPTKSTAEVDMIMERLYTAITYALLQYAHKLLSNFVLFKIDLRPLDFHPLHSAPCMV